MTVEDQGSKSVHGNALIQEEAIYRRYSVGAQQKEEALCCPVNYPVEYLKVIPTEVLERDYGCGDPSTFVKPGDVVLDLGAGGGKICFIAAQIAGPTGKVIGVDCNREMLSLARTAQREVARRLGFDNIDFRCGLIQDLGLDLELLAEELKTSPVGNQWDYLKLRGMEERLRREHPLIPNESVDCILSNCVLNLVRPQDREQLFAEAFRVLKRGGRVAISDIVSDEDIPRELQEDGELWSGCLSGAYREDRFLHAFEAAGFHGIEIVTRQETPWRVIQGIEFRSLTVLGYKGKQGPCLERLQAVIYRGPFKKVEDDDGHSYPRGERIAVCDKTFQLLQREPYSGFFETVSPLVPIPLEAAAAFDCRRSRLRHPHETKGREYKETNLGEECCLTGDRCC